MGFLKYYSSYLQLCAFPLTPTLFALIHSFHILLNIPLPHSPPPSLCIEGRVTIVSHDHRIYSWASQSFRNHRVSTSGEQGISLTPRSMIMTSLLPGNISYLLEYSFSTALMVFKPIFTPAPSVHFLLSFTSPWLLCRFLFLLHVFPSCGKYPEIRPNPCLVWIWCTTKLKN